MKNLTLSVQCRRATETHGGAGAEVPGPKDKRREYKAEWQRAWRLSHPGYEAEYRREFRKEHPDNVAMCARKWRESNPEKAKAHDIANYARRAGVLVATTCEKCGAATVEMHHPDYAKPLAVVWLCRSCHKNLHRKQKLLMKSA